MFRIMVSVILFITLCVSTADPVQAARYRARECGITFNTAASGVGTNNAITDVPGVLVGHVNVHDLVDKTYFTGVTAIVPHGGNVFQDKVPGAYFRGNGFGKMAGGTQIMELGNIETPIVLTNTLSIAAGLRGIIDHTLAQPGNENVASVNAVVGETNDNSLGQIRTARVTREHVMEAIQNAKGGPVEEGSIGAGSGTSTFSAKGGIGTASRRVTISNVVYHVGVLVQTNFGGTMTIDGMRVGNTFLEPIPVPNPTPEEVLSPGFDPDDGSCMIVVATDAPVCSRNLERLAKRAFTAMGRTGASYSNGSGDYIIAFSTAPAIRIPHNSNTLEAGIQMDRVLYNDSMGSLFTAAVGATEEAIINALFAATTVQRLNANGTVASTSRAIDIPRVLDRMTELGYQGIIRPWLP